MPTLAHSNLPTPKSWSEFEDICLSAAIIRWNSSHFHANGRQGQKQYGVDIYGKDDKGSVIGIQCKNTALGISVSTIRNEIANAEAFRPMIKRLVIATTAKRNARLQERIREISQDRSKKGAFTVEIFFWEDICHDLTSSEKRLFQHYPQLRPRKGTSKRLHDRKVFTKFQKTFPFSPTVELLRDHDFGDSFRSKDIQYLIDFVVTGQSVENEFVDAELEGNRVELYLAAKKLYDTIMETVVYVGSGSTTLSVLPDYHRGGPRPDFIKNDAKKLNRASHDFVPIYEAFVRKCKAKLYG